MAQLSRPYQIGIAAVAVLAVAWLLLLRGHGESSPSSTASSAPAVVHHAPAKAATGRAGQATGGGSASSLGAYGHAIEKARGAVTTSQHNANRLEEHSNQASSATPSQTTASTPSASASAPSTTAASPSKTATAPSTTAASPPKTATAPTKAATKPATPAARPKPKTAAGAPTRQHAVEVQLAQGKVAVILFWDRSGTDDRLVRAALRSLRGDRSLAIDEAAAGEVAAFGTITRGVQVYGTPTMLIVNSQGKTRTLTGLQDSFAIAQAVAEAHHS